jgi:hypothetical protein
VEELFHGCLRRASYADQTGRPFASPRLGFEFNTVAMDGLLERGCAEQDVVRVSA